MSEQEFSPEQIEMFAQLVATGINHERKRILDAINAWGLDDHEMVQLASVYAAVEDKLKGKENV